MSGILPVDQCLPQTFLIIYERGIPSVPFMKDIFDDTMLETSLWFLEYGVGRGTLPGSLNRNLLSL
jgi:hypothetical protein